MLFVRDNGWLGMLNLAGYVVSKALAARAAPFVTVLGAASLIRVESAGDVFRVVHESQISLLLPSAGRLECMIRFSHLLMVADLPDRLTPPFARPTCCTASHGHSCQGRADGVLGTSCTEPVRSDRLERR
jgi:hypothetical protein